MSDETKKAEQVENAEAAESAKKAETAESTKKAEPAEKTKKQSWFHGLKTEFGRITWPDRKTLIRETVTVTVVSVVLGVIIATLDMILQYGINFLV